MQIYSKYMNNNGNTLKGNFICFANRKCPAKIIALSDIGSSMHKPRLPMCIEGVRYTGKYQIENNFAFLPCQYQYSRWALNCIRSHVSRIQYSPEDHSDIWMYRKPHQSRGVLYTLPSYSSKQRNIHSSYLDSWMIPMLFFLPQNHTGALSSIRCKNYLLCKNYSTPFVYIPII